MELVSKPNVTAAVWEHFGFKLNDRGEPLTGFQTASGRILRPKFETVQPHFTFSRACATSKFAGVFFFLFFTLACGRGKSNNLESQVAGDVCGGGGS